MHELALARNILRMIQEHAPPDRLAAVRCVRVDLGRLAGVVPESLAFCFAALVSETPLRDVTLELTTVPLRLACADCQQTLDSAADRFSCPQCGGPRTTVVAGMELLVREIELADETEQSA